jgi:hypothetical protein
MEGLSAFTKEGDATSWFQRERMNEHHPTLRFFVLHMREGLQNDMWKK